MLILKNTEYKETLKARYFYCLVSIIDSAIISFLLIFINQLFFDLKLEEYYLSIALFTLPILSSLFIFLFSFLATHHLKIIKVMRIIFIINFLLILITGFLIIYFPIDINNNLSKDTFFYLIVTLVSLLAAFHSALLSLQSSSIAYINQKEKTSYGYVCLYGSLVSATISPISGLIASSLFHDYRGYGFSFLIFSPVFILLAFLTFKFAPFHDYTDGDNFKFVSAKSLFKDKRYIKYFLIVLILIPFSSLSQSLTSTMFDFLETNRENGSNLFNSTSYGLLLGFVALIEFVIIYVNTKIGIGKKIETSTKIAYISLIIRLIFLSIIFYFALSFKNISLLLLLFFTNSFAGVTSGLYVTSNMRALNRMMSSRKRTKAIFLQNGSYQIVTAFFSLIYPILINSDEYGFEDCLLFLLVSIFLINVIINFNLNEDIEYKLLI